MSFAHFASETSWVAVPLLIVWPAGAKQPTKNLAPDARVRSFGSGAQRKPLYAAVKKPPVTCQPGTGNASAAESGVADPDSPPGLTTRFEERRTTFVGPAA